jgi:predicted Fe-Mo cluster-binding NifX family protein
MKLCIPTMDDKGLQAVPSAHFGSAPFFTFVDTDTGEVEAQRNGGDHHAHGACRPLDFLGTRSVDAIVCRGLGRRAFSRLESGGVAVYVSLEKDVEATVAAFKDGRLRHLTSEEACQGHDHDHGHGHGQGLGQGRGHPGGFGYGGRA